MQPQQAELLRSLPVQQRDHSLAVVADDRPVIGLLPFALSADGRARIVHASRLARHTAGRPVSGSGGAVNRTTRTLPAPAAASALRWGADLSPTNYGGARSPASWILSTQRDRRRVRG